MPKVICWQTDCLYNAHGHCRAEQIEYDPDDGCLTQEPRLNYENPDQAEDDWEEEGSYLHADEQ
jgi:hypothetical protein